MPRPDESIGKTGIAVRRDGNGEYAVTAMAERAMSFVPPKAR